MPNATKYSLVTLAQMGGFTGASAYTAALVAYAESSGNPKAVSSTNDYGLWQINSVAHPQYDKQKLLDDPIYNATAAYEVYKAAGNSFTPWVTFNHGKQNATTAAEANAQNYSRAIQPVGHGAPALSSWSYLGKVIGTSTGAGENQPTPTQDNTYSLGNIGGSLIPGWLNTIGGALTNQSFWTKIGLVIVAGIVMITGLFIWIGSNKDVQSAVKVAAVA